MGFIKSKLKSLVHSKASSIKTSDRIIDQIKTFEDACTKLGENHPYVKSYEKYANIANEEELDIIAYLKLRIITAALNEGWKAEFTPTEHRYYPYFSLITKEEYDGLDDAGKAKCVQNNNQNFPYIYSVGYGIHSRSNYGSYLALKSQELAEYADKQFVNEWADFIFK